MRTHKTSPAQRIHTAALYRGAKQTGCRGLFAWLPALASILAVISLSSCAGFTSAHSAASPGALGTGVLTPSATTLSFGSVGVGNNPTQTLSFTNTGTATINIDSASISGAGFTAVGGSPLSVIGVGQSGSLQIQF